MITVSWFLDIAVCLNTKMYSGILVMSFHVHACIQTAFIIVLLFPIYGEMVWVDKCSKKLNALMTVTPLIGGEHKIWSQDLKLMLKQPWHQKQ